MKTAAAPRQIGRVEPVTKTWLSKSEACAYLGCSPRFLDNLRNSGEISYARYGRNMLWYELRSLERFFNRNKIV